MRLLGKERVGGAIEKYWLHTGPDGKDRITVETTEDVEPVFDRVRAEAQNARGDTRLVASIPATVVSEICKINAERWGISPSEVFRELMSSDSQRAKDVWSLLCTGREYRRLQAKHYGS